MQDKFNLTGFLKNNDLLKESAIGYADIKPVKEDDQSDSYSEEQSDFDRALDLYGAQLKKVALAMYDDGFDIDDVSNFFMAYSKHLWSEGF